jgi:hypothetical protein
MAAFVELVVADELGIRSLCPTPRDCTDLVRKGAHGDGYGDPFRREKAELVFPINTPGRHDRICQPVERDVVKDIVPCKASVLSVKGACDELITARVVVK